MSVSAQAGIFGFGPQTGKGVVATSIYRHRATLVDVDLADDVREGPPEVGGVAVPTFPYKSGPVVAGGATIQPRLENTLGWLLYAMLGGVTSSVRSDGVSHLHKFAFDALDPTFVPWLTLEKYIPKINGQVGSDLLQVFQDCKIISAAFTFPNDGPIATRLDSIGRMMNLVDPAPVGSPPVSPVAWANSMEFWPSIPVACLTGGYIKVGGTQLPVITCQVGYQNVPLDLRSERIYGTPYLDDITIVQRRLTFDITVKYQTQDLYRSVLGSSPTATAWGPRPFTAALDIKTVSQGLLPPVGSPPTTPTDPYSLEIKSDEIMLSQVGGLPLQGNQAVLMRFTGVALEAVNYVEFDLINEESGYSWPM